jgi:hypothetical protein
MLDSLKLNFVYKNDKVNNDLKIKNSNQMRFSLPGDTFTKSLSNASKIGFQGFTRLVRRTPEKHRPFYCPEDFLAITDEFKSKTAGKLPKEFLTLFPGQPKKLFEFLDGFANATKQLDFYYATTPAKDFTVNLSSGKQIKCKFLDSGQYGQVFKIDVSGKPYVFKVFNKGNRELSANGNIGETRTGLNLSGKKYKDITRLHIANFDKDKGWAIMEYIDSEKDFAEKRDGKWLYEDRPDIRLADDKYENTINDIRVDHGDITSVEETSPRLKSDKLPEDDKKENNFQICIIPKDDRKKAFYDILNNLDPKTKEGIASQIYYLPESDRKQAFYDVLNHPDIEARKGISSQIENLYKDDKKDAFYDVLNHDDTEARKGISSQIWCLPKDDRKQAFYDILNHDDPEARKDIGAQIFHLHEDDRKKAFYDVLKHPDIEARKKLDDQIEYLYQNDIKEAFYAILNHDDPRMKERIGSRIDLLPTKADSEEAFKEVLKVFSPSSIAKIKFSDEAN